MLHSDIVHPILVQYCNVFVCITTANLVQTVHHSLAHITLLSILIFACSVITFLHKWLTTFKSTKPQSLQ